MSEGQNLGPAPEDIITALERTGFLLEQQAAQQLEAAGFSVLINDAFPDPDEGKSRETDILAEIQTAESGTGEISAYGTVLIECKNYSNPVALIGKESFESWAPVDTCFPTFDPFSFGYPRRRANIPIHHRLGLQRGVADGQAEIFTGNQIVLMSRKQNKWVAENSSVYDSVLYPLLKARQYEVTSQSEQPVEVPWINPGVSYCFPVLLVSGDVYTVAVRGGEQPKVAKAKWAVLRRVFHLKGMRTTLYADVVSFVYFTEYIQRRILGTLAYASETLKRHPKFYDPEWLAEKYGVPPEKRKFEAWLTYFRRERDL
jgi:hypothetical protein